MKRLNIILLSLLAIVFTCCTSDEFLTSNNSGYLTVNIKTVNSTNDKGSRAIPADYNATQLAIEIVNTAGKTVMQTDDASMWQGQSLELKPGTYTVNVHSNNWDGNDSGRDVPFYAGSTTVTISTNVKSEANVVCTLANVKVSVNFDSSVAEKFSSAYVEVSSAVTGILSQTFTMGNAGTLVAAYFPVGSITATLHVTNKSGVEYTKATKLTDVKARDHYILRYSVENAGDGEFTVTAQDNETTYTYNLYVPGDPVVAFNTTTTVNEWATMAMVEGTITSTDISDFDPSNVIMQYTATSASRADDDEWTSVPTTKDGDVYRATLSDLKAGTVYNCRLVYDNGKNVYVGTTVSFTTEAAEQLPNSGFEDWYTSSKLPYACSEADFANFFWGSSNVNAVITQIIGCDQTTVCHSGSKAAKLTSKYVNVIGIKKFAAGSIFTGKMPVTKGTSGASIDFGRPFTSRPSELTGYFKYSTDKINQTGSYALPEGSNVVKGTTDDLWSAYMVLLSTDNAFVFSNATQTDLNNSVAQLESFRNGTADNVVAFGELPNSACVTAGDWTKFSVKLHYFKTDVKPVQIVLVFSSSKYGDYFTGCDKSVLILDDIEMVYGEPSF